MEELGGEKDQATNTTDLQEENRKLKEENRKLRERLKRNEEEVSPACLQNIVEEVKKNEMEMGYELENDKFFRIMFVLCRHYSSVLELVANLLVCFIKINRKCGGYGERQLKRGKGDDDMGENAPKKRKMV